MIMDDPVNLTINSDVRLLTQKYEKEYIRVHNDDAYWTSEKILKAKDKFRVFVVTNGEKIIGYLDITYNSVQDEPYALWVKKEYAFRGYEKDLLLSAIKLNKSKSMMVLIEKDNLDLIKIYESVGFKHIKGQNSIYATYVS